MKDYEPTMSFSDRAAARFHDHRGDEPLVVEFLKSLAGPGPALELAIGTGRIALPLAEQGIEVDAVRIGVLKHDAATQTIEQNHVALSTEGIRLNPVAQRYAWPTELDLMAQLAGLGLQQRWGGWSREPFESSSSFHVSVYGV